MILYELIKLIVGMNHWIEALIYPVNLLWTIRSGLLAKIPWISVQKWELNPPNFCTEPWNLETNIYTMIWNETLEQNQDKLTR